MDRLELLRLTATVNSAPWLKHTIESCDALAVHTRHPIGSTPALLAQMRDFGNRAGITLVI